MTGSINPLLHHFCLIILRTVKHYFTEGSSPFICGGYGSSGSTDLCYTYTAALDEWVISGTMAEERGRSGYASSDTWGLIMAGGYNYGSGSLASVETSYDGESFASLPAMPDESRNSCLVVIDEENILKCGGLPTYTDTLMFSKSTNTWST